MSPSAPESEDRMQTLVARYPELITDGDGDLLLIKREQVINDGESGGRWSLDHLFVTRDAIPVLVELKRAIDTRLRREVVGQMLDYAANATAYWQAGRIADSYVSTATEAGLDAAAILGDFIGEADPANFWNQVDANFTAGRIKLVFVADEIPRELARIVEFLNDQMRADVRAVELRWFSGHGGIITLSPRVIGETERAAVAKGPTTPLEPMSRDEWLEKHIAPAGEAALAGARSYIAAVQQAGGIADVARTHGSIFGAFTGYDGMTFHPLRLWNDGSVSFELRYLFNRPSLSNKEIRQELYDELTKAVGPLSTSNLEGAPAFKVSILADTEVSARFKDWISASIERMY